MSRVVLEIEFMESQTPPWAEWEMWREELADGRSEWISQGTAPSLEAAVDHALNAWRDAQPTAEEVGQPLSRAEASD